MTLSQILSIIGLTKRKTDILTVLKQPYDMMKDNIKAGY